MPKKSEKVQKNKATSKRQAEYTISEFMELELPEASLLIEERLGEQYVGPFMKRYTHISDAYDVNFPKLKAAFRKLDLLLASEDRALIETAARRKNLDIKGMKAAFDAGDFTALKSRSDLKQVLELANADGWETWPHGNERRANPGSGPKQTDSTQRRAAFTECHETVRVEHDVWIPEMEAAFEKLNGLLAAIPA